MNERQNIGYVSLAIKLKRSLWNVVACVLFRPFATKVFRLWRLALLKMFGAQVPWTVEVYSSAEIWAPWNLKMEEGSCIGPHVICYNLAMVWLKKNSCLSQYAYVCAAGHDAVDVNNAKTSLIVAPITLEEEAWVGTRAFVGMGVVVGYHAVVGATASVYKDVEAFTVVGGNPAKVIKHLSIVDASCTILPHETTPLKFDPSK